MAAVRVPPSACSTSQSTAMVFSPERAQVDAGPQRAADQPGDLVGAAADPALDRLPVVAFVGGRRQHRVLGGQPAEAGTLAPARHPGGHRRRAQHLGAAELDQHGPCRVLLETAGESHRPKFVVGPAVSSVHAQKASATGLGHAARARPSTGQTGTLMPGTELISGPRNRCPSRANGSGSPVARNSCGADGVVPAASRSSSVSRR